MNNLRVLAAIALGGVFAATVVFGLSTEARTAAAVALTVYLWATMVLPEFYTALMFIALVLVFGIAGDDVALAGFGSKAVWLVFAGIVLGAAIQKHGIGAALFDRLLGRLRSYPMLVWSVALAGLLLSFLIPSAMGRVVLIAPLAAALCDRLALDRNANERLGVYMTAVVGTTVPAFTILTSNVPNLVLLGAMEASYGHGISYSDYLLLHFPALGVGSFLLIPLTALFLFPGHIAPQADERRRPEPWTGVQTRLAIILVATVAAWASDKLHGIPAAWIGLAAALVCMAPRLGVVAPSILKDLNFGPWFFVAGTIGLGAVVQHSGLGSELWQYLSTLAPLSTLPAPLQYAVLVAGTMAIPVFTTLPAAPSIFTPLAGSVAETLGWPLDSVILAQVPSFVVFALPYQVPPVLVGLTLLDVPLGRAMRLLGITFAAGVLVLVPAHYLWGRFLGVFP